MKAVMIKVFLISVSLGSILNLSAQDFNLDDYKSAFEVLKSDTLLSKKYCEGGVFSASLFPGFQYLPISTFDYFLEQDGVVDREMRSIRKLDKRQEKNRNSGDYRRMDDQFYQSIGGSDAPCAVVCFDRMKNNFIVARVGYFGIGPSWESIVRGRSYHVVIFDTRHRPFRYLVHEVIR